ncbi:hypothetical protein [Streptomyces sp. KLOTTS4A1]|uniref:hypothetical protein n=1 Tax=Streptomyces sp. KLOTTS4A1 TaxID=3390996 RepID=UPI0039F48803
MPDDGAVSAALGGLASTKVDPDAQAAAVAAFRAARDSGAHSAVRTRRRDDWRPRRPRRGMAWRPALGALLAGLTVGGVAFAAAEGGGRTPEGEAGAPTTAPVAPERQEQEQEGDGERTGRGAPTGAPSAHPSGPGFEHSTEALCRTFDKAGGKALDASARQRLVDAAGGEEAVAAYCLRMSEEAEAAAGAGPGDPGNDKSRPAKGDTAEHGQAGHTSGQGSRPQVR